MPGYLYGGRRQAPPFFLERAMEQSDREAESQATINRGRKAYPHSTTPGKGGRNGCG